MGALLLIVGLAVLGFGLRGLSLFFSGYILRLRLQSTISKVI